jgi:hypothetical protein
VFKLFGGFAELAAKDPNLPRGLNRQGHAVARNPANFDRDVVAYVNLLTNLSA